MNTLPKRNEVARDMQWRLEDIYPSIAAWEEDRKKVLALGGRFADYKGRLSEKGEVLYGAWSLYEEIQHILDRMLGYAHMMHDGDTANSQNQELYQRARNVMRKFSEQAAFFEPELLEIKEDRLKTLYKEERGLERYRIPMDEILRQKEHTLSEEVERLLASSGDMAATAANAFSMLANADMKFPTVVKNGEEIALSNGRFVALQMSPDRNLRKEVFEKYYETYQKFSNTWAALYDGQIKKQIFYARARKYPSTFVAAVDQNNVDPAVCDQLIESVHRHMDKMHRYVSLRKKMLGLSDLHMYDVYVPMVEDYDAAVSWEEAKEMTLQALAPLGEDYLAIVRRAFDEGWIDVAENEGKRGGAYSSGVYDVHPYMLLNFNKRLEDVFTLVHEMGHSLHTWYSSKNQTIFNAEYKIFVAEVASTTNEILLLEYLLEKAEDVKEKAYLVNHYLESFKSTLYRQTMFEEFERATNAMGEAGEALTGDRLSQAYYNLNKEYFGPDIIVDPQISFEWCRIPHFYYNFYVYQYATSFAASVTIAHRILGGGEEDLKTYLDFLKSGCTKDPVSLLREAGVDLSTGRPIDQALEIFDQAITEMEKLAGEI